MAKIELMYSLELGKAAYEKVVKELEDEIFYA